VIGLAFRSGLESVETFQTALALDPNARCWAIVPNGDVEAVRGAWQDSAESALLIIRSPSESALGVAAELLQDLPAGPAALLLANLPPQTGLFSSKRYAPEAIQRLHESRPDLQVHVHSADWLRRPPRIR
jgi:hypothetical protein